MRQYVNSVLRRLWWFAAIPTIWHISLVSSLVIRQSQPSTNNTVSPEVLTAGQELQNCASAVMIPVLQFVITNYIAHAFTVRFSPGYGKFYTIIFSLKALVFPCFGLLTACRAMENRTRKEDPLIHALKAGALCTIARTEEWKPENGDIIWLPQR
jgi:hypothetical protein